MLRVMDLATMEIADITEGWLQQQQFKPVAAADMEGVRQRRLQSHLDGRGEVTELWSRPWEGFVAPDHVYQSATDAGVVKCWHLHAVHTDQFVVTRGKLQVALVDVRPDSPTFGGYASVFMGTHNPLLLQIPPGVMHGWKALTSHEVIVLNLQSHVYDSHDEYKFTWNCVLEDVWEPRNG